MKKLVLPMPLHFRAGSTPELPFQQAIKKPIPVNCVQIMEAFEVETLEGLMQGKAGDWLMVGNDEDMWVIDDAIFQKTYEIVT